MGNPFDLEVDFERVNWRGPTTATYATLAGLLGAHMAHIPFENFDVLLGRGARLDLDGLQAKLVKARRGGRPGWLSSGPLPGKNRTTPWT